MVIYVVINGITYQQSVVYVTIVYIEILYGGIMILYTPIPICYWRTNVGIYQNWQTLKANISVTIWDGNKSLITDGK